MQAPPLLDCVFLVNIGFNGYQKKLNIIYKGIEDLELDVLKLDASYSRVWLKGVINPTSFISKLYKAKSCVTLGRLQYGNEENLKETRKPNSPFMKCCFKLNALDISWSRRIIGVLKDIQDLSFTIDALKTMPNSESGNFASFNLPNVLVHLHGAIDPVTFISKLYKARFHVRLDQICYGYEENPEGTRKPNSHFMNCLFELNTSDISWYMKITGPLKAIQGVSFKINAQPKIDAPQEMEYAVDLCGNVEIGVLMKMVERTGIELLKMGYGVEYKDANMNPTPKKLENPANGTETQMGKDTEPPPSEVVCTSAKHQVIHRKPRGLRTIASLFCRPKNGT